MKVRGSWASDNDPTVCDLVEGQRKEIARLTAENQTLRESNSEMLAHGLRLKMEVELLAGRKHLPVVRLQRAA